MASVWNRAWNWHDEGFLEMPKELVARQSVRIFRVWDGVASFEYGNPGRAGTCFTFHQPETRMEAEKLLSVFEWGNACRYITPFQIAPGTSLFIGKVHPGDFHLNGLEAPGSQVFIEAAMLPRVLKAGPAKELANDLGAHVLARNRARIPS